MRVLLRLLGLFAIALALWGVAFPAQVQQFSGPEQLAKDLAKRYATLRWSVVKTLPETFRGVLTEDFRVLASPRPKAASESRDMLWAHSKSAVTPTVESARREVRDDKRTFLATCRVRYKTGLVAEDTWLQTEKGLFLVSRKVVQAPGTAGP